MSFYGKDYGYNRQEIVHCISTKKKSSTKLNCFSTMFRHLICRLV